METTKLRRFAQYARRTLLEQVGTKMDMVLAIDSAARRENYKAVQDLEKQIKDASKEHVIEKVAYTWFNRFCALRFMDVNRYSRIGVVSPLEGQFQPEILSEAKMGHIDEEMVPANVRQQIAGLLNGNVTSRDPQQEAYRLLVVAACNDFHRAMPYLFERIADYTELLMPDDLLSGNAILAYTREAMPPDVCEDVEVIGWLYQFYISEKKDEVFNGLKKSGKIAPEDIPAATQLFTPHYIVRYLVENSLGRLWLLNHPSSRLAEKMDYYIMPEQTETDFVRISKPEDIKVCDPACGSGHMLTYAFDLLYAIYEEAGADPVEIPEKILTQNLYGIEIDERAAELAAFALAMKARAKQRRFLSKRIQPNICALQTVKIEPQDLDDYMATVGKDLFSTDLRTLLTQFEEADNFGSLICPVHLDTIPLRQSLLEKGIGSQLLLEHVQKKVFRILDQTEYLSQRYQVVVANPPYMGSGGMNRRLGAWAKENYPDSKADLFSMFIERNLALAVKEGVVGMITMQSWMFLSSFEKLRSKILRNQTLVSMAHLGARAFDSIGGEVVSTTAFVLKNANQPAFKGESLRLVNGKSEAEKDQMLRAAVKNSGCGWLYRASIADYNKIPGSPIAYWVSEKVRGIFESEPSLGSLIEAKQGLGTGDDSRFFRFFWEVSKDKIGFNFATANDGWDRNKKWFPLNKGGSFRKWYGNNEYLIAFDKENRDFLKELGNHLPSEHKYFQPFITWSDITSATNSFRKFDQGFLFSNTGHCAFPTSQEQEAILLSYCNNKFVNMMAKILNPTIHFHVGYFNLLPYPKKLEGKSEEVKQITDALVSAARADWNSYETSWSFSNSILPLTDGHQPTINATYANVRASWRKAALAMQQFEQENNRIFIEAYGLQDELKPDVPLNEITLTCNPHYYYGGEKSEQELEDLLRANTMGEFISYAVGCMFGRYSLDEPGLIIANQGETLADYLRQVPQPRFTPGEDNVIPILDGDWFADDITGRFREFLRVSFGDEHYDENLSFIETALGKKGKPLLIRDYFLKDFYTDHVKRYKKRPIYWLFSSPKGTFNALIYMHRYRPDTVGVVLNDYLREFRTKLAARKSHLEQVSINSNASAGEKTKALKEIEILKKNIVELEGYERDVLYPLATRQLELDLDDGIKVNYGKFGAALKKIVGLDAPED